MWCWQRPNDMLLVASYMYNTAFKIHFALHNLIAKKSIFMMTRWQLYFSKISLESENTLWLCAQFIFARWTHVSWCYHTDDIEVRWVPGKKGWHKKWHIEEWHPNWNDKWSVYMHHEATEQCNLLFTSYDRTRHGTDRAWLYVWSFRQPIWNPHIIKYPKSVDVNYLDGVKLQELSN